MEEEQNLRDSGTRRNKRTRNKNLKNGLENNSGRDTCKRHAKNYMKSRAGG